MLVYQRVVGVVVVVLVVVAAQWGKMCVSILQAATPKPWRPSWPPHPSTRCAETGEVHRGCQWLS